jgi:cytochrome c peroxidase
MGACINFESLSKFLLYITILIVLAVGIAELLSSCKKDQNTEGLTLLQQEIPASFPQPAYTFNDNPLSEEGFQLGKRLFYDGRLSIDNEHPCSSCHEQRGAFGTFEHDRSHGVYHSHTLRNAPALSNLAWSTSFHWDGAFTSIADEASQPINGHVEMGETWEGVISKLESDKSYRDEFKKVFRYPFIRPEFVQKALAQFIGSIVSYDSKYDRVVKGLDAFSAQELNGYQVFQSKCAGCHTEPLFTNNAYYNIGLPVDPALNDFGRMRVTGLSTDSLKFKVPSLRNCNMTSNYMHDGRFNTLGQVIDHYRFRVQAGPTVDPLIGSGIVMTDVQAHDLTQFLKTLSDSSILSNPRYR